MENNNILETDIVSPQEGQNVSEEVEGSFENVFTKSRFNTEREVVSSYDALNSSFMIIDDIRNDFGRMSNSNEVYLLQKELNKLIPGLNLTENGIFGFETERALDYFDQLVQSM